MEDIPTIENVLNYICLPNWEQTVCEQNRYSLFNAIISTKNGSKRGGFQSRMKVWTGGLKPSELWAGSN